MTERETTHRYRFDSRFVSRINFLFCSFFAFNVYFLLFHNKRMFNNVLFYAFVCMHACIRALHSHAFPLHYSNMCNALYMIWCSCIYMPNRAQHNRTKKKEKYCTAIEQTILSKNDLYTRVCFR